MIKDMFAKLGKEFWIWRRNNMTVVGLNMIRFLNHHHHQPTNQSITCPHNPPFQCSYIGPGPDAPSPVGDSIMLDISDEILEDFIRLIVSFGMMEALASPRVVQNMYRGPIARPIIKHKRKDMGG